MSIADVASRLYSSSAYRNTPVIKALADSVKMNLKFRFSLVGMAAALTGSQTLYQIAQQKYLITDEERKQAKEEIHFKKYVVSSISTLSKQVALIESIVEKNSLMINAIASDLGYFKRQRKINPMSMNSGMLKSFRVPANSKTVKGRIELINAELAALKGIRIAEADAKQKKVLKETEKREKDKQRGLISAAVAAAVAGTTAIISGAGLGVATAAASAGAVAGGAIGSQVGKQIVGSAIPVLSKVFKISLLGNLALGTADRFARRGRGESGVQLGDASSYINNIDQKKDPTGYALREQEIELLKSLSAFLEEFSKPIDASLVTITTFLGYKYGLEFYDALKTLGRGGKMPKGKGGILKFLPGLLGGTAASSAVRVATAADLGVAGTAAATGTAATAGATAAGAAGAAAATATRAKIPKKILIFLKKLVTSKGFRLIPGVALSGTVWHIAQLYNAYSNYTGTPTEEFKQNFISSVSGIIQTGGASLLGAAIGAAAGGPAAPITALLGAGTGLAIGFLGEGPANWTALQIFDLLYDSPTYETADSKVTALSLGQSTNQSTGPSTGPVSVRNNNPGNLKYVGQPGAVGADARGFAIFPTAEAGMEAMRKQIILDTQTRSMTLTQFIQKYAPPNENDTKKYIEYVGKQTGLKPNDRIPIESIPALQAAMIAMEGGSAATSYFASGGAGGNVIAPTSTSAMMAGTGLASTLDTQLFQFFGKEFAKVDSVRTEQQAAQDMGARAKIDMVEKAVEISREKSKAELAAMAAETQKMLDMKNLEATNYVDDKAFDEEFAGLYKVA